MNKSPAKNFPSKAGLSIGEGEGFIGLAALALPAEMNFSVQTLIQKCVERDLEIAGVIFAGGWKYDQFRAIALLKVSDWRSAVTCVRNTFEFLDLAAWSGIWRYDFAENYWREVCGNLNVDFETFKESVSPVFSAKQQASRSALTEHLEKLLTSYGRR